MFVLSVPCNLVITCWKKADLVAFLCVMYFCNFVTFPYGVQGLVWYLSVLIPGHSFFFTSKPYDHNLLDEKSALIGIDVKGLLCLVFLLMRIIASFLVTLYRCGMTG